MAEFSLIEHYFTRPLKNSADMGVGDDSAILACPPHQQLVVCTDTLVAGRHFPLDTAAHAVGWKSVAVNLSDLAAMGAKPHSILLALSLPEVNHPWLYDFSQGLFACCDQFAVELVGGDTTQSPQLTITITALGYVEPGKAVLRSGAQTGDYIVVSGQVGSAAYALDHIDSPLKSYLDYPTPRCELGQSLQGLASSMIDISDGLAQDLGHILKASACGAYIDLEQLPTNPILHRLPQTEQWQYALAGGDDYELCFTVAPQHYERLLQNNPEIKLTRIGYITEQPDLVFKYNNQLYPLHVKGYQHFA